MSAGCRLGGDVRGGGHGGGLAAGLGVGLLYGGGPPDGLEGHADVEAQPQHAHAGEVEHVVQVTVLVDDVVGGRALHHDGDGEQEEAGDDRREEQRAPALVPVGGTVELDAVLDGQLGRDDAAEGRHDGDAGQDEVAGELRRQEDAGDDGRDEQDRVEGGEDGAKDLEEVGHGSAFDSDSLGRGMREDSHNKYIITQRLIKSNTYDSQETEVGCIDFLVFL